MAHCTRCHNPILFGGFHVAGEQFCSGACLLQSRGLSEPKPWHDLPRRLPALALAVAGYLCLISSVPFMFAFSQGASSEAGLFLLLTILLPVVGIALLALGDGIDRKAILAMYREAAEPTAPTSA